MPFTGTRQDVSNVVVDVIQRAEGKNNIGEATVFGKDLIVDPFIRRGYASRIINRFEERFPGSDVTGFGEDDCAAAGRVKDIVDALWGVVNPN
jgi:hypothetical protein